MQYQKLKSDVYTERMLSQTGNEIATIATSEGEIWEISITKAAVKLLKFTFLSFTSKCGSVMSH